MARTAPHVVATRLTKQQYGALKLVALSRHSTIGAVTQHALLALTVRGAAKTDGLFRDLLKELGIDPDAATAQEVRDAIQPLIDSIAMPEDADEPLAEGADPAAPKPGAQKTEQAAMSKPAKPDADGFVRSSALAFPTTPAQQKQWVADRAAQRAKRSNPLKAAQAARTKVQK